MLVSCVDRSHHVSATDQSNRSSISGFFSCSYFSRKIPIRHILLFTPRLASQSRLHNLCPAQDETHGSMRPINASAGSAAHFRRFDREFTASLNVHATAEMGCKSDDRRTSAFLTELTMYKTFVSVKKGHADAKDGDTIPGFGFKRNVLLVACVIGTA